MIFEGDYVKTCELLGLVKYSNAYTGYYVEELRLFNPQYPRLTPEPSWHQIEVVGNIYQDTIDSINENLTKI